MKNLISSLTCFFLLATFSTNAQKNAPVAGDAATLIDLLNKDYGQLNSTTLTSVMNNDRAKVIAVFKKYIISDKKSANVSTASMSSINTVVLSEVIKTKNDLQDSETKVKIYESADLSHPNYDTISKNIEKTRENVFIIKKRLQKDQLNVHLKEFDNLKAKFNKNSNTYLAASIDLFKTKYISIYNDAIDTAAMENTFGSIQKSQSFLTGNLAFETLIDGLAKFLVNRVKEELSVYVMEQLKQNFKSVASNKNNILNEMVLLMPETANFIKKYESEYGANAINDIKQYIEKDLNLLVPNIYNLKKSERVKACLITNPELSFTIEALRLIPQLSKANHPTDYLEILSNSLLLTDNFNDNPTGKKIIETLQTSQLFLHSLTAIDNNEVKLISTQFVSTYASQDNFLVLFIGLINQQALKYLKKDGANYLNFNKLMVKVKPEDLSNTKNDITALTTPLFSIVQNAERLYQNAQKIKSQSDEEDSLKPEVLYEYIDDFISLFEASFKNALAANVYNTNTNNIEIKDNLEHFIGIARQSNKVVLDLKNKRYNAAITNALEIPSQLIDDGEMDGYKEALMLTRFYNNVALAEDADGVENAIRLFAAPQGSYKNKREASSHVSINSYPGLFGGLEFSNDDSLKTATSIGLTAPVGISTNLGFLKKWSLFITVIDIAAPFRLRLDDDNATKTISNYTFKNIVAPGLYISIPFNESPLALNIGAQYGPELDFKENTEGELTNTFAETFRLGFALTVDIPILTLYSRKKPTKQ